jgi:nitroimidazol reductase NimA-like FMN-containing flavoprotein (pyridoxamine 5'-phosphate oxidase superfamily)
MEISMKPQVQELANSECWQLLRDAPFGRLAVVLDRRPDVFPVNHVVDRGSLVFRTDPGAKLLGAVGHAVAFEVDGLDEASGQAWSVVAKGRAHEVRQLHEVVETVALPLFPWQGGSKPHFVRIEVEEVTGRRFTRAAPSASPAAAPYTNPRAAED